MTDGDYCILLGLTLTSGNATDNRMFIPMLDGVARDLPGLES